MDHRLNASSFTDICRGAVYTPDGMYGPVEDVILRDDSWELTHLVCISDGETAGRDVLIPFGLITDIDLESGRFKLDKTHDELRQSLALATGNAAVRQHGRVTAHRRQTRPIYVAGVSRGDQPQPLAPGHPTTEAESDLGTEDGDVMMRLNDGAHYRRISDLIDYHLKSEDGVIGPVTEVIVNLNQRRLSHLVVRLFDNRAKRHILLPLPELAVWQQRRLRVGVTAEQIDAGPVLTTDTAVTTAETDKVNEYYASVKGTN